MTGKTMAQSQLHKILIIDDDPSGAQLLATLLELEGYQACQIANWKEPLQDIEQDRPDLVLIDIRLRTRSGFDVLAQIRSHPDPELANTPVLMMSAEDYRVKSRQAGANGFVPKPLDLPAFYAIIREIEEGNLSKTD